MRRVELTYLVREGQAWKCLRVMDNDVMEKRNTSEFQTWFAGFCFFLVPEGGSVWY